jgi:hypothetical protein
MSALRQAPVLKYDRMPDPADVYAELAWLAFRPELGNLVVILPLTPGVVRGRKASTG